MKTPALIRDIDWTRWMPRQRATLLFVVCDGEMLLIRKKRGLGAGKINGPGGRIEPGETPTQAAVREVQEELRVTPVGVQPSGELFFQFVDGLSLHVYVFRAAGCQGEPQETEEAVPLWVKTHAVPYERMWQDDAHWLPLMMNGTPFRGFFLFDGDRLIDWRVETGAPASG